MNPDEYYVWENDRAYINPFLSRDEQMGFVDTLRNSISKNNDVISSQTQKLGTDIQPSLGGLTGSEGYFKQRYQTTPVETHVNTLKATAQAKALNDLMTNYQEQAKNRYQQAYRSAQKRASSSGKKDGDVKENDPAQLSDLELTIDTDQLSTDYPEEEGTITKYMTGDNYWYTKNNDTGKILETNDPDFIKGSDGYYHSKSAMKQNGYKQIKDYKGWHDKYIDPNTGEAIYFPIWSIQGYSGF